MQKKLHIKKGDRVKVIAGESKGSEGKVLFIDRDKNRATVEGVNLVSVHTKPNAQHPDGGIIQKEATVHLSNLMIVDGSGNASRIGRKVENGKIVRYSKKSGENIK
ncbi:MAG: 50S ribosomal protein L24 [Salibacteraceae bacterium]